ncbi:MAG: hypothetical protein [Bacteriophage sp.]|nr:MAG: hypothetical protein [Bacteriophage sp.]
MLIYKGNEFPGTDQISRYNY